VYNLCVCVCVVYTGASLHDGSYLTPGDLAGLRQTSNSPDTSPMAAMLRDAAVSGAGAAGHFGGGGPPPPTPPGVPAPGQPGHGLPPGSMHPPPAPFGRYSGLRHPAGPPQQTPLPPNSAQTSGPNQPAVEVPAEIW